MNFRGLAIAVLLPLLSCSSPMSLTSSPSQPVAESVFQRRIWEQTQEEALLRRSRAMRERVAAEDLNELDAWWRRVKLGDPHKYLLPVILARLTLPQQYDSQATWEVLAKLDQDKPDLYHFRSIFDIRLFFLFRDSLPPEAEASYRQMLETPEVLEWMEQGTENHMFMQRASGLALMDGSGWPNAAPAVAATNEAWLRAELDKYLTIGQGEFHSSTYYGYTIAGLLNIYDFAKTPELRQLAKAILDWLAANMAVRLSWGTAGGAESRGFDRGTWDSSELSTVAWVWWGDRPETAKRIPARYAWVGVPAALSTYRPPPELTALARKDVPLPFVLKASHPIYYSYSRGNQFWETFYVTQDYSLATLLIPQRSYRVEGTINAQYATYKLVIRDPKGEKNAVVSLGGTYHTPLAMGHSPGDQFVQEKGAVIYQLRLNQRDIAAGVPQRSHLVLPTRYGQPQQYGNWYILRVENSWLCAHPWGESVNWQPQVSQKSKEYQVLAANGVNTAWVTEIIPTAEAPDFNTLTQALEKTKIEDKDWQNKGKLVYKSWAGDQIELTYKDSGSIGQARINGIERVLGNWDVLESPYLQQKLNSGVLKLVHPGGKWKLEKTDIP